MTDIQDEFQKSTTPHDAAFRLAFRKKDIAEAFFRHHLSEKVARHMDFSTLEPVPCSFVDENFRQRHADLVYRVRFKGKPVFLYILFEHQSTPVPRMSFRALCYMVNIWKDVEQHHPDAELPMILPVVLYHGKRNWNAPLNFRDMLDGYDEDLACYTPDFAYHLFVNVVDDNGLTVGGNMALAVVLHLFKHIFDDTFGEVFQGTAELVVGIEDEPILLEILEWIIMYALNARNEDAGDIIDIVTEQAGKIGKEKIRRVIMTAAEQLRQEGKLAGLQEGKLMGLQEGKWIGLQEGRIKTTDILLKQLRKKIGRVSPPLERNLRQSDLDVLDRFGESIFDFTSLEDAELWWERHGGQGNA